MAQLSESGKEEALRLARWCLKKVVLGINEPKPHLGDSLFTEKRGVFITLKSGRDLRGCIGTVEPVFTLEKGICEMAQGAATRDPRFPPVTAEELEKISIEISILTPPEEISGPSEIEVGTHGLIVELGSFKGLLLPQVAVEESWEAVKFLNYTCQKAGLPKDTWKAGDCKIFRFTATVFGEYDSYIS
ncbi:MAG: AmmeMemoRadiSam system protein A [Candidatus Marinimicrobia bacterium]|nr:AmmeMemoRadiSam system protein A [Candidatus Neomarinimicrobiota bacterium]